MRGNCIQDMVRFLILFSRLARLLEKLLIMATDAPADTMESDSQFRSGEKPVMKTDSPANR